MIHFNKEAVLDLVPINDDLIDCVRQGAVAERNGDYEIPERMHLDHEHGTLLVMPSISSNYSSTKIVQVNKIKNPNLVEGVITLFDARNGQALATMDAPIVTNLRTGAVGALGLSLCSSSSIHSIGMIGSGEQAFWQIVCACIGRSIETVYLFSRTLSKMQFLKKRLLDKFPDLIIEICNSEAEVVIKTSVIYTCTTSNVPVLPEDFNYSEKVLISIGSFKPTMQELPDSAFRNGVQLIIDSVTALKEVGDLVNPLKKGFIVSEQVHVLGDVLKYDNGAKFKIFKSVGQAAFDLALSVYIYQAYLNQNKNKKTKEF